MADGLITPAVQKTYVDAVRGAGKQVDYRTHPGLGHVDRVEADSPLIGQLMAWPAQRFAASGSECAQFATAANPVRDQPRPRALLAVSAANARATEQKV